MQATPEQIDEKRYYTPVLERGLPIYKIGIACYKSRRGSNDEENLYMPYYDNIEWPKPAELLVSGLAAEFPGDNFPEDDTADFGKLIFEQAADKIVRETLHRLNNIGMYKSHGNSLNEGIWKE